MNPSASLQAVIRISGADQVLQTMPPSRNSSADYVHNVMENLDGSDFCHVRAEARVEWKSSSRDDHVLYVRIAGT